VNTPSHPWLAPVIAAVVVAAGALALWLWKPVRPAGTEPTGRPPAAPADDLQWEEARAKKLPEYAELKALFGPQKQFTDEQVTRVLELAGHRNVWIRLLALNRLAHVAGLRQAEAVDRLVRSLCDPNFHVRVAAMNALAEADARDRVPDLLPFLDRDEREVAKRALKRLGHPVGD